MQKTNVLLYGSGGSGKTVSTISLLKPEMLKKVPDLQLRFLITETNSLYGIKEGLKIHGINLKPGQVVYSQVMPTSAVAPSSAVRAKEYLDNFINKDDRAAMQVTTSVEARKKRKTIYTMLTRMATFKGIDFLTKEEKDYGDFLTWGSNVVFVIDGMTQIVNNLVDEVRGERQVSTLQEYGFVQGNLINKVITPLTTQTEASVIMLAHPDLAEDPDVVQPREMDGKILRLYPKTYGKQLNNSLPGMFTDTIYCYETNGSFHWAGQKPATTCSVRNIPKKDRLKPDFSLPEYTFFQEI